MAQFNLETVKISIKKEYFSKVFLPLSLYEGAPHTQHHFSRFLILGPFTVRLSKKGKKKTEEKINLKIEKSHAEKMA